MTSVVRPVVREIVRAVSRGVVRDSSIVRNLINFRAVMQSRVESDFNLQDGDVIEFNYLAPRDTSTFRYLFDGSTDGAGADRIFAVMGTNGFWSVGGHTGATVDGVSIIGQAYPIDGRFHTFRTTVSGARVLERIASRFNDQDFYSGFIYDFTVTRGSTVVLRYRLDDTLNTNVIIDSSGGGNNGTAFGLGAADSEPYTLLTGTGYLQVANNYTGGALSGTVNTTVTGLTSGGVYRMILSNPTNADITFTSGANSVVISVGDTEADLTLASTSVVITGSGVTTEFTPRVSRLLEFTP